jgi:hypothetical protein
MKGFVSELVGRLKYDFSQWGPISTIMGAIGMVGAFTALILFWFLESHISLGIGIILLLWAVAAWVKAQYKTPLIWYGGIMTCVVAVLFWVSAEGFVYTDSDGVLSTLNKAAAKADQDMVHSRSFILKLHLIFRDENVGSGGWNADLKRLQDYESKLYEVLPLRGVRHKNGIESARAYDLFQNNIAREIAQGKELAERYGVQNNPYFKKMWKEDSNLAVYTPILPKIQHVYEMRYYALWFAGAYGALFLVYVSIFVLCHIRDRRKQAHQEWAANVEAN